MPFFPCVTFLALLLLQPAIAQEPGPAVSWTRFSNNAESAARGRTHSVFDREILGQIQFYPNALARLAEGELAFSAQRARSDGLDFQRFDSYRVAWGRRKPEHFLLQNMALSFVRQQAVPYPYWLDFGLQLEHSREWMLSFGTAGLRWLGPGLLEAGLSVDWIHSEPGEYAYHKARGETGKALALNMGLGYRYHSRKWTHRESGATLGWEAGVQTSFNRYGPPLSYTNGEEDALPFTALASASLRTTLGSAAGRPILQLMAVMERQADLVRYRRVTESVQGVPDSQPGDPENPFNPDNPTGYDHLSFQERQEDGADDPDIHSWDSSYRLWPGALPGGSGVLSNRIGYTVTLLGVASVHIGSYKGAEGLPHHDTRGWSVRGEGFAALFESMDPGNSWSRFLRKYRLYYSNASFSDKPGSALDSGVDHLQSLELRVGF